MSSYSQIQIWLAREPTELSSKLYIHHELITSHGDGMTFFVLRHRHVTNYVSETKKKKHKSKNNVPVALSCSVGIMASLHLALILSEFKTPP